MMEGPSLETGFRLFAVVGLILLNGFFVAAEFAIVTVRKTRVDQLVAERRVGASAVAVGLRDTDSFVAACQLGITMASLGLGWIGEPAIVAIIEPWFHSLPANLGPITSHTIAVILSFALITFLHMILGEQVPKIAALNNTERVALFVSPLTVVFGRVFLPFIAMVNRSTSITLRILGLSGSGGHHFVHSVEELRMLVGESGDAGLLKEDEREIAIRAFTLSEFSVGDVMIPRTEVTAVPASTMLDELLGRFADDGHSRLPVFQGTVDNVIGVVHVKDMLKALNAEIPNKNLTVREIMHQALFVPETKPAKDVVPLMQSQRRQMAIVIDEYGGTAGIVTLEDILERLIGDVQDEFELPEERFQKREDGTFTVNGLVSLAELSDGLNFDIESEDFNTIGGYVFGLLGRTPVLDDEVTFQGLRARIVELDGRRIARLVLTPVRDLESETRENSTNGEDS